MSSGTFTSPTAQAATGINKQINFQGKLVNPNGTNVTNGSYSIVFSIYTVSSGGAAVWTETQTPTVTDGIFQVQLGSVTSLPGSVDFNTDNIYLGIKVGADAEMTPRIRFASVPQAFNSEKLGGIESTGFAQLAPSAVQGINSANTAIRINQTGAGNLLQLQGDSSDVLTLSKTGNLTTTGSGTFSGGSLTVGTTTQAGTLIVNDGNGGQTATIQVGNITANTLLTLPATLGAADTFCFVTLANCGGGSSSGAAGALQFSNGSGGFSADATNIFWDNTNKQLRVGGALTTPDTLAKIAISTGATTNKGLVIQGVASQAADLIQFQNSTGTNLIRINAAGTLQGADGSGTDIAGSNIIIAGGQGTGTGAGGEILFQTSSAGTTGSALNGLGTRVRINSSGMSIGTSNPEGTFEVSSDDNPLIDLNDGNDYQILVRHENATLGNASGIGFTVTNAADNVGAAIIHTRTGGNSMGGLGFYTKRVTTAGGDPQLAMLLTDAGNAEFSGNVTVAAQQTITMVGGTTAQRPASPTEGTMFFDSSTKQLITYSNGKWQATNGEYLIVAASNSSQSIKDAAHYVADGDNVAGAATIDGDQVQINAALTAAAGRTVYLAPGTYVADASISIPNNTTLAGAGRSSLVEFADIDIADSLIENSDTTTGTGVTIQNLRIDGRKDLNTLGSQEGIFLTGMGAGTGSAARQGAKLALLWIDNFTSAGVRTSSTLNSSFTNLSLVNNDYGFYSSSTDQSVFGNNIVQGNIQMGIYIGASCNLNTITGNVIEGNTGHGIRFFSATLNTISGNDISRNGTYGVSFASSADDNMFSTNKLYNNGGNTTNNAVYIDSSDTNTISSNVIADLSGTTTNYAINIFNNTSDSNYIADNTLGGATINDLGTATIYSNQLDANGQFINRGIKGVSFNTTTNTAAMNIQGGIIGTQLPNVGTVTPAVVGTTGTTTRRYQVTGLDGTGETLPSTIVQVTTANATLTASNRVDLSWPNIPGAVQYRIYTCSVASCTPTLLATATTNSYQHTANGSPSGALPTVNTTGNLLLAGSATLSGGALTVGTTTQAGSLIVNDGNGGQTATIQVGNITANTILTLPATLGATDTFCFQTLANCGGSGVNTVGTFSATNTAAGGATISSSTIIFQSASTAAPGMVSTSAQTFAGDKTFSGYVRLGTDDTTAGWAGIYGGGAGATEGGNLKLYLSSDHDTTYDGFNIRAINSDFEINADGGTLLRIQSTTGNVGIGTASPGTKLSISGGNNINPAWPDGLIGARIVQTVTAVSTYTVPNGKNLYITSAASESASSTALQINNQNIFYGKYTGTLDAGGGTGSDGLGQPIIAGPGSVIKCSSACTYVINGMLVNAGVTSLTQTVVANTTTYTVPVDKRLFILNVADTIATNLSNVYINGTSVAFAGPNGKHDGSSPSSSALKQPIIADAGDVITTNSGRSIVINGYLTKSTGLGGADLAERYFANGSLEPGDVVMVDASSRADKPTVSKSGMAYDARVLGIVTTQPNQVYEEDLTRNSNEPQADVALAGRVPVKISGENGSIKVGDPLAPSSIPGVAMKATKAGRIIGTAMEVSDCSDISCQSKVLAFVQLDSFTPKQPTHSLKDVMQYGFMLIVITYAVSQKAKPLKRKIKLKH